MEMKMVLGNTFLGTATTVVTILSEYFAEFPLGHKTCLLMFAFPALYHVLTGKGERVSVGW